METLCSQCLGCNRLEYENFKEVYRCEYFLKWKEGDTNEKKSNNESIGIYATRR
jgi:hypothetical protein